MGPVIQRVDSNGTEIKAKNLLLRDHLYRAESFLDDGAFEGILRGLTKQVKSKYNFLIVERFLEELILRFQMISDCIIPHIHMI